MYEELFGELVGELAGIAMPGPLQAPAQPPDVDLERFAGSYERLSVRYDLAPEDGRLVGTVTLSGPIAEITPNPVTKVTFIPVDGKTFLVHDEESETPSPAVFYEFHDGIPQYLHSGARANPRVDRLTRAFVGWHDAWRPHLGPPTIRWQPDRPYRWRRTRVIAMGRGRTAMRAETVTMARQWGIGERRARRRRMSAAAAVSALIGVGGVAGAASAGEQAATAPAAGGTVTVTVGADPGSLDPHLSVIATTNFVNSFAYETLVYLGQDGEITPGLAESWEDSPTSVTYTLKDGVTCADGTPLTATTVADNFSFIADPANQSPLLGPYVPPGNHRRSRRRGAHGHADE